MSRPRCAKEGCGRLERDDIHCGCIACMDFAHAFIPPAVPENSFDAITRDRFSGEHNRPAEPAAAPGTKGEPLCYCGHAERHHPESRGTYCVMAHCFCRKFRAVASDPNKSGWSVWNCDDGTVQVVPKFGKEHTFYADCWCNPHWDTKVKGLLIHECDN